MGRRRTAVLPFASAVLLFSSVAYSADDGNYLELVRRVKSGDFTIDFRALRLACLRSRSCQPRGSKVELTAMNAAHEQGDFRSEAKWAQRLVEIGFANIEAHATLAGLYTQTNEPVKAKFHLDVSAGLLRSIMNSGDGKTKKTAFEVIADREEYAVLTAIGLPYAGANVVASRFTENAHNFNQWQILDTRTGQPRTVYFNEDAFIPAKSLAQYR